MSVSSDILSAHAAKIRMADEKRKDHRQTLKYPAKIDLGDGTPLVSCMLTDVSAVRRAASWSSRPDKIPESFSLLLARRARRAAPLQGGVARSQSDRRRIPQVARRERMPGRTRPARTPRVRAIAPRRSRPELSGISRCGTSAPLTNRDPPRSVPPRHNIPGPRLELSNPIHIGAGPWTSIAAASIARFRAERRRAGRQRLATPAAAAPLVDARRRCHHARRARRRRRRPDQHAAGGDRPDRRRARAAGARPRRLSRRRAQAADRHADHRRARRDPARSSPAARR